VEIVWVMVGMTERGQQLEIRKIKKSYTSSSSNLVKYVRNVSRTME
jgi:hypothetical protein